MNILQFPRIDPNYFSTDKPDRFLSEANVNFREPIPTIQTQLSCEDESLVAREDQELGLNDVSSKWTGWMKGQEFGPVDYSQLLMWAVTGQLSPMDFVRRENKDQQYVPAVNIPCLFTVRAAATSLARRQISNAMSAPAIKLEDLT